MRYVVLQMSVLNPYHELMQGTAWRSKPCDKLAALRLMVARTALQNSLLVAAAAQTSCADRR